ncbi:MAG: uracil-DNA glycosylase family protein [Clostridiales bacterium]
MKLKDPVIKDIEKIKSCKTCNLYNNQKPLLDNIKYDRVDVMWIGLSAKLVKDLVLDIPLSVDTNSGNLINEIENENLLIKFYKTNLVKCLPLDNNDKLRYPKQIEIDSCVKHIKSEIDFLKPKIIFLLGNKVSGAIEKHFKIKFNKTFDGYIYKSYFNEGILFIPIHHPSYISVYKRKDKQLYIESIQSIIDKEF